jgi:hypothetical protein
MAVTAFWFANAFEAAFDKEIDFLADVMNVQLHTDSYTPNQDTNDYQDDLTNEVANGNGYTTGGEALGGKTHDNTLNVSKFAASNTVWTSSGAGFTARRSVLLDATPGTAATNPLLCWMDFGQDETASGGGTFTIQWNASGIATITATDAAGFP